MAGLEEGGERDQQPATLGAAGVLRLCRVPLAPFQGAGEDLGRLAPPAPLLVTAGIVQDVTRAPPAPGPALPPVRALVSGHHATSRRRRTVHCTPL